jgi:lipopolysaccharide transport system permease protein
LPISKIAVTAVDLGIRLLILFLLMIYYQYLPGWRLLFVPLLVLAIAMFALGMGTFFAAWNVAFRDASRVQSYIIKFGLFLTPAIYMDVHDTFEKPAASQQVVAAETTTASRDAARDAGKTTDVKASRQKDEHAVPDKLQWLMELNPMMGIISSFRAAILNRPLPWPQLSYSLITTTLMFVIGCLYFEKTQRDFADVI